jgi:hypothetical protein
LVALLALVALAAVPLPGCGGGGGEDVEKVLGETFGGDKNVRSGRLDLTLTLETRGLPQLSRPVSVRLTGPFQSQGRRDIPRFDFDLSLNASGQSFRAGAVSTGTAGFLEFQGRPYAVPANVFASFRQGYQRSQGQRRGRDNPSFASLGVDPRDWLKDAEDEGEADVGGAKTTHVSAGVDVPRMLVDVNKILQRAGQLGVAQNRQLPSRLTPAQRKKVADAIEEARFDVYTGRDDRILRRMVVDVRFEVPARERAGLNGLEGGRVRFDLQIAGLNQPQRIRAPRAARPFAELTAQLRSVLGRGDAAGGGASPAPAPGGGTGGDAKAQRYLRCLQQAGGDIARAQRCRSLLEGG